MTISPRFTIIIPTRDRCDTLAYTLQTCLQQNYQNFEVIVSDNYSSDQTKKFVSGLNHPNLKYINTGSRVSMSENWEFALQAVTGDYITIVGDDDALLPGALTAISTIINDTKTKAISWKQASYHWPNHIVPAERNILSIPLLNKLEKRNAKEHLQSVLNFEIGYDEISFLYKGMIHKNLINEVKEISGGVFFHSQTPDLYASIVLSSLIDTYYFSEKPFSINGASANSNGTAQFNQNISTTEHAKFRSENTIPFHSNICSCASIPILTAECFYQAQDKISLIKKDFCIEPVKLVMAALRDALASPPWRFLQISEAINGTIEKNQWLELLPLAKSQLSTYKENLPADKSRLGYHQRSNTIVINGADFFIQNIYDASLFCIFAENYKKMGLSINRFEVFLIKVKLKSHKILKFIKIHFAKK